MAQVWMKSPDGQTVAVEARPDEPVRAVAERLAPEAAQRAVVARLGGTLVDLAHPVGEGGQLELFDPFSPVGIDVVRHSTAHLMAQALQRLLPGTRLAIGPTIEDGFYYDVAPSRPLSADDLPAIEAEMRRIVQEDLPIVREEIPREQALAFFRERGDKYKVEILEELDQPTVSLYRQGEFVDLCRGPHVPSTGRLGHFRLLNLAGAYWRGDARRDQLTRIYGTAFPTQEALEEYVRMLEEAARRDHRRIGRELGLFLWVDEGPGFPFFLPNGVIVRNALVEFSRAEQRRRGYQEVMTPLILRDTLWRRSGHYEHYRENMYFTEIEGESFAIKPMNCPGAYLIYSSDVRSYRDLPLRLMEFGLVHRHELSGVLNGLKRVRAFTQDDAHIFVRPDQIADEVMAVLELIEHMYGAFGFPYRIELSTRPENAMGSEELWERATQALREALDKSGRPYQVNEGEGAFYGPKIDFHVRDSLGRSWQCGTVQLDLMAAERFDLTYVGADGQRHRPVVIHRALFGSLERFIAVLVEHYAGALPVWLSPVQLRLIPVADRHRERAEAVAAELRQAGLRVEVDGRDEKVGYKIRDAQLKKIPYMAVVGDREVASGQLSVRHRSEGELGAMSVESVKQRLLQEIQARR
ncbi:threonine--tRNA ligase [Geochorda subterranea]|uniref:Threonine--tRNA ligase n=1 Tax=Geochorda subterranea TaxID=3109564 RepID=A0ABZ1BS84_9FIRM|nr:threonine--tRNA ligase [Limnochorda sp. LNt]WRP15671.1 threonine--tRNA ligase [Limnochorda sp. LNt]